jgi:hypothetical protein
MTGRQACRSSWLVGVMLALSLSANFLLLLAARPRPSTPTSAPAGPAVAPGAPATAARARPPVALIDPCGDQLQRAQDQIDSLEELLAASQHAAEAFAAARASNPTLERQFKEHVALAPGANLTCRDRVCRVEYPGNPPPGFDETRDSQRMMRDPWIAPRRRSVQFGQRTFHVRFSQDDDVPGKEVLDQVVRTLFEQRAVESCQPPPGGTLAAYLETLPRYEPENGDGKAKITFGVQGSLMGTPFALCVAGKIGDIITQTEVPAKVTRVLFHDVGLWPASAQERSRKISGVSVAGNPAAPGTVR